MTQLESIVVGSMCWEEDSEKFLKSSEVSDVLNEKIDLSHFGYGLDSIFFVPMGYKTDDTFHPEKISFRPSRKELDIRLKLDYPKMKKATDEEFLHMVAQLFLSAIDRFPQRRIPEFDIPKFKADVTRVFREQGWVV